jgi:lysine N6-hydroxylase
MTKGDKYELQFHQWQQNKDFTHESEVVILGTGYRPNVPDFIKNLGSYIYWDKSKGDMRWSLIIVYV